MSRLEDVQAFIELSRQVASPEELHELMQSISWEMGFDHFALVHHIDLGSIGQLADPALTDEFIALSDYPQNWIDQYISEMKVTTDPVLTASRKMNVGFAWEELPQLINLTPSQLAFAERSRRAGLVDGFTVPANVPGELNGSCNFAIAAGNELPRRNLAMAQLVGSFAFQGARDEVSRRRLAMPFESPRLSQRQLECIILVARGKTDWEIGKILGISEETVKWHLKEARERYEVSKRVQVVLRALFDGQIPLNELID